MGLNQKICQSKLRKLCRLGIKGQVVSMLLLIMVWWSFQSSSLFSGSHSLHAHARGILSKVIFSEEFDSTTPATEVSSGLSFVSATEPRLPPEKANISNLSSLKRANVSLDERKETPAKNRRRQEPDWTEDMNIRNCTREKDPLRLKRRANVPIWSIQEMTQMLLRNQRSSCLKGPEWSSPIDQDILRARREILSGPFMDDDPELHPPVYRNFSTFKRSYELMEKMLKVYVYKEGERPIFHRPLLWGIYAAEGWFMKHMEENAHFVVDDPAKAHLFYMPYSSSELRFTLFDPVIRDKNILVDQLRSYVSKISSRYPFWNRTGGTDHFSVACHDWASLYKMKAMGDSIMATCNADITWAFELGKDVSITLTPVRNWQNPVQNAGGLPGLKRDTLAFFAGQMHGNVRPLVFEYWGDNKDSDIQAFRRLPRGGRTYAERMKSSKFCLCPSGYEVNSPRLAETFFYECVPVIISDNFVPPFFDVLNWEAFSVVVPVKDIPRLKEILLSVSPAKYRALHYGVKMVQRHFLWHLKPERYDLFHMTLHSVWFNRVLQFRDLTGENLA